MNLHLIRKTVPSVLKCGSTKIKISIYVKINMFLLPKKFKYKKIHKNRLKKFKYKNKLLYGEIGIKSTESGTITSRQLEAARQAISRKIERKGKLWIRPFPNLPVTKKSSEARMGKGVGSISFWAAKVKGGSIIFEITGVKKSLCIEAFKTGRAKLPIKTKVVFL